MTDLTEQYKEKELEWYRNYYVDLENNGNVKELYLDDDWCFYDGIVDHDLKHNPYMRVLGKVPSYEELQSMNEAVNQAMAANIKLVERVKQLEHWLKECRHIMSVEADFASCHFEKEKLIELIENIDEVLNA